MADHFIAGRVSDEIYTPVQVIVGATPVVTKSETFITGANVAALTVCGRITASGKLIKSVSTAVDGSQVPCAIAIHDVASAAADKVGPAYLQGEFNIDALVWDASFDTDAKKLAAFTGGHIIPRKLLYSVG